MKRIFKIIFLNFSVFFCYGQTPDVKIENKIYLKAVQEYVKQLENFYTTDFYSQNKKKILYFKKEKFLNNIPNEIDGYKIVEIDEKNKRKFFKNKPKLLVTIFPLKYEEKKYYVNITPFSVAFKNRKYVQTVSDWTIVYFENIGGKLEYKKTENDGI